MASNENEEMPRNPSNQSAQILIKHISNAREISVRPSSSSESSSSLPPPPPTPPPQQLRRPQNSHLLLPAKSDSENQTVKKITRHATSSSAIVIGHNEDLLTKIFLGLPPKSLLRFQRVSKQWLSIISDSNFRRLHCRRYASSSSVPSALFLYSGEARQLNFVSFREENVNSMNALTSRLRDFVSGKHCGLHSCNGLLCIDIYCEREDPNDGIMVYNPTTGQCRHIPFPTNLYIYRAAHIAFDPVKSDHYKIVCVWRHAFSDSYDLIVYSSETLCWQHTEDRLYGPECPDIEPLYCRWGVFCNGDFHWFRKGGYEFGRLRTAETLCFDLDNNCLRAEMPELPFQLYQWDDPLAWDDHDPLHYDPYPDHEWDISYFGESGGQLLLIGPNVPQTLVFDVFQLEMDYSQWTPKCRVDFAPLTAVYPSMVAGNYDATFGGHCSFYLTNYFLVNDKEYETRFVIWLVDKVISYDIEHMTVKDLAEVEPVDVDSLRGDVLMYKWTDAYQHTETLAFV